jgi:VWFA-related protein
VILLAGLLLALAPVAPPEPPVFSSGTEAVYVDVFVTSHGLPVTGLRAADFEVKDDGVLQDARLVSLETLRLTPVLVFDTSGSLEGKNLAHLRAAGHAFVDGLRGDEQAALLTFSHEIVLRVPPTSDRRVLHESLDHVKAGGSTAVLDALYAALRLRWSAGRAAIVLFTDGDDNLSWLDAEAVLTAARESTALVDVVTAGETDAGNLVTVGPIRLPPTESAYVKLLREVARTTGGTVWPSTYAGLRRAFLEVLGSLHMRYVLSYEPQGVAHQGRHRLEVRVKDRSAEVQARTEYWVER